MTEEEKIITIDPEDEKALDDGEKILQKELRDARLTNRVVQRSPSLTSKISKYIERHGLDCSVEYIYKRMEEDDGIIASIFEKEPLKQNFVEKYIFKAIKDGAGLQDSDATNYPTKTKTYLIKGRIKENNDSDYSMKTVDFRFFKNGITYYCTQKYTTTYGSNQDDRFSELLHFIKSNSKAPNPKIVPVALADGSYFKRIATKYKSKFSNFKYMKEIARDCKVMTYLQFIEYLKTH